jgi:hypothetical protein
MKLATLKRTYDELNDSQFAGLLVRPRFFAIRNNREYASYLARDPEPSIIYFFAAAIKGYWARSIVYHEMTHQYLEEFLGVEEEDHHGPIFWKNYRKFAPKNVILFEEL